MSGDSSDSGSSVLRRMEVFAESMSPLEPPHLRHIEARALSEGIPVIRPGTRDLIRFFIRMKKPVRILEVGTATGFSSLFMYYYAPPGCRITTIEKDPCRVREAKMNIRRFCINRYDGGAAAGPGQEEITQGEDFSGKSLPDGAFSGGSSPGRAHSGKILSEDGLPVEVLEGDALEILKEIREDASFDLIFMDAAKGQYIRLLPEVVRLLAADGILLTDNILKEGEVLSSRYAVTRRNRTIHSRMREYLRALFEETELETLLLPTGDGTAVCVKLSS